MDLSFQRPLVLVIDDNCDAADLMVELLQACGHHSIAAYGGVPGIQAIRNLCPDVVLLDLLMPQMDGFQVAAETRKLSQDSHPALIAFSALSDHATVNLAMKTGFDLHLPKPATLKQVISVIEKARALTRQRSGPDVTGNGAYRLQQQSDVANDFTHGSGF